MATNAAGTAGGGVANGAEGKMDDPQDTVAQEHLDQAAACTPCKIMVIAGGNVHRVGRRRPPWPFQGTRPCILILDYKISK